MKNIFKALGWVVLELFTTIAAFLIILLVLLLSHTANIEFAKSNSLNLIFSVAAVSDIIIVLIAVLACRMKKLNPASEWKLCRRPPKAYLMPCGIAFTYSAFFFLITHSSSDYSLSPAVILCFLIISPISDEIINRGVILNTLKKSFPAGKAIIISAVFHALSALSKLNVLSVINSVILCIILSVIYEKTGSLRAAITANAVTVIFSILRYIVPEIPDFIKFTAAPVMLIVSVVLTAVWLKPKKE